MLAAINHCRCIFKPLQAATATNALVAHCPPLTAKPPAHCHGNCPHSAQRLASCRLLETTAAPEGLVPPARLTDSHPATLLSAPYVTALLPAACSLTLKGSQWLVYGCAMPANTTQGMICRRQATGSANQGFESRGCAPKRLADGIVVCLFPGAPYAAAPASMAAPAAPAAWRLPRLLIAAPVTTINAANTAAAMFQGHA